jgi:threonine dehydratase
LEFLEQAPQLDTLVVPISGLFTFLCQSISQKCFKICFAFGIPLLIFQQMKTAGGGLISGVALAAKSINPAIRILAAEPKGADDAAQSKAAGRIITLPETNTIADGLRAFLGDFTW